MEAKKLNEQINSKVGNPVIGVFATGDPRIDQESRKRCQW